MPRIYDIVFENVTVSAAQDLVSFIGSANKVQKVKRVRVGATNTAIPTAQMLQLRSRVGSATFALGSGGTVPTAARRDPGDSAAGVTAHVNDTAKATAGTFIISDEAGPHIYAGYDYTFPQGQEPVVNGAAEGFVFELLSTVSGTCAFSGGVTIEESGG